MIKRLIGILTIVLFVSCRTNIEKHNIKKDISEIYNMALDITTGSDTIYRYHLRIPPLPPLMPDANRADSLERQNLLEELNRRKGILDTAELFVVVKHEVLTLSESEIANIMQTIVSNKNNLKLKMDGDTTFNQMLIKLCNDELDYDTIDVSKLKTRYNYTIYSDRSFPEDRMRLIGKVGFSKIAFSKENAYVYTSFVCGSLCGYGQILYFKKTEGTWTYIRSWDLWVS